MHYNARGKNEYFSLTNIYLTFFQSGVVPFLLETVGSEDKELQEASAGCLKNIRELALRAEEYALFRE